MSKRTIITEQSLDIEFDIELGDLLKKHGFFPIKCNKDTADVYYIKKHKKKKIKKEQFLEWERMIKQTGEK